MPTNQGLPSDLSEFGEGQCWNLFMNSFVTPKASTLWNWHHSVSHTVDMQKPLAHCIPALIYQELRLQESATFYHHDVSNIQETHNLEVTRNPNQLNPPTFQPNFASCGSNQPRPWTSAWMKAKIVSRLIKFINWFNRNTGTICKTKPGLISYCLTCHIYVYTYIIYIYMCKYIRQYEIMYICNYIHIIHAISYMEKKSYKVRMTRQSRDEFDSSHSSEMSAHVGVGVLKPKLTSLKLGEPNWCPHQLKWGILLLRSRQHLGCQVQLSNPKWNKGDNDFLSDLVLMSVCLT